ncbi:pyruvate decarboxylase [Aulographum hederae CBS 113979]|uniref:Pyruvate decarboxylase n=1 Tax=Aulographum hederae CBS 113979 TaxID=1176131 RepID=A0A6G1GJF2_9PEZI|nr:pyruvate decarboxylase [Aulographum hederae CBS 113979]
MASDGSKISMGQYLFKRISQLGVQHVLGVPGDFNLFLLDELFKVPELKWLGACNELNAAYAADGYARIRGIPGVLVTTYAVGELSAMNGVAGAYAEHAGFIHIVGMTSRLVQKAKMCIHHTLEPGMDHQIYVGMSEPVRSAHTVLMDDSTMAEEIDRVIEAAVKTRLPVYIYVPMDVPAVKLDAKRLETPLNTQVENKDAKLEDTLVQKILEKIKGASNPAILADVLAVRHGGRDLTKKLIEITHLPSYSTPLSKGVFDETSPYNNGLYNGEVSFPGVSDTLEKSDVVLNIGPLLSDSNTGGFTRRLTEKQVVMLAHDHIQIDGEKFEGVHFLPVLKKLVVELEKSPKEYNLPRPQNWSTIETPVLSSLTAGPITQDYIWQRLGRFLRPNDILLTEAGTAQFGMPDATFPANIQHVTQTFWSSIGYTVGACLGACVAAKELNHPGRVILIVGEGSLQMTVQEIGSYIRFGFKPIIFVVNNNGYSIERAINGPEQTYNEVSMLWDHQSLLEMLGARKATGIQSRSFACKTVEEVEKVLDDEQFAKAEYIQLCEIFMDQFDYPWRLTGQLQVARAKFAKMAEEAES